ncbi:MAG: M3 family oligoendopeptidase [Chloroflexi bacterium]|nr:M3 family oligoendopeptidase [Chloroflexota bacterium]
MLSTLPPNTDTVLDWDWGMYKPYFDELLNASLTEETVFDWLKGWSRLISLAIEAGSRMHVAHTIDTNDAMAEQRFHFFIQEVRPEIERADNELNKRFLASGLEPQGFEMALKAMRADDENFAEENLPLLAEEATLELRYNKIMSEQTIEWEGEERTLWQIGKVSQNPDRALREKAWRMASDRMLQDREAVNENYVKLLDLRQRIARNAGLPDYRAYIWNEKRRFDYSPEDCVTFQNAIEEVVVPAAGRLYEKTRAALGVETLRPWDINTNPINNVDQAVDPFGRPPLAPFADGSDLAKKAQQVLTQVDRDFGDYLKTMIDEGLLDLDNRKGKAPGGYCTSFPVRKRPFIFMNAVGIHQNVVTMLHEAGHAFHAFEASTIPYHLQRRAPMEFNEVASMAMELLSAPYWQKEHGGYYDELDYVRARTEHLQRIIMFWPYMAVVDAFQHWVYSNVEVASDPANLDAKWGELWDRFMPHVDWTDLEVHKVTGWHRKQHIHRAPFYYVEYGMAQLGAVQVWANALKDQEAAVAAYRSALEIGGREPLPKLFEAAGARFAFDTDILKMAVDLIEETLTSLNAKMN